MFKHILFLSIFFSLFLTGCGTPQSKKVTIEKHELINVLLSRNSSLNDDNISALYNEGNKRLWIATKNGLFKLEGNSIIKAPEKISKRLSEEHISAISGDNKGTIFIGTYKTIYLWVNKRNISSHNVSKVNTLYWDKDKNSLYAGTDNGIVKFSKGKWENMDSSNSVFSLYKRDENLGQDLLKVKSIAKENNRLWIGTGDGLISLEGKKSEIFYASHKRPGPDNHLTMIPGNSELAGNKVNSIIISNGKKWIGTGNGISAFSSTDSFWELYTSDHSELTDIDGKWVDKKVAGNSELIGNWINDLCSYEGNIYIATTNGLSILNTSSNKWRNISKKDGLINKKIRCLEIYNKKLYAGSIYGLSEIDLSVLGEQK